MVENIRQVVPSLSPRRRRRRPAESWNWKSCCAGSARSQAVSGHPGVQLLLPPRQYRRGPASNPPRRERRRYRRLGRPRPGTMSRMPSPTPSPTGLDARRRNAREFLNERLRQSRCLTAHPTEVRRKSTMRREMAHGRTAQPARARRLTRRGTAGTFDEQLVRNMLVLWQTNLLRQTRLGRVEDEVTNGNSYFDYTFLRELPKPLRQSGGSPGDALDPETAEDALGGSFLPADRQLDRRRPRRQSVRHADVLRTRPCAARAQGHRLLPR